MPEILPLTGVIDYVIIGTPNYLSDAPVIIKFPFWTFTYDNPDVFKDMLSRMGLQA